MDIRLDTRTIYWKLVYCAKSLSSLLCRFTHAAQQSIRGGRKIMSISSLKDPPCHYTPAESSRTEMTVLLCKSQCLRPHNPSSRTKPTATYLRKLSRISINKFRADGRACSRYRGTTFSSRRPPLTLLIAATPRIAAHRFPTKLAHLTLTVIWRSFFSSL